MLTIKDNAKAELKRLLESQGHPDWGIRVGVKAGGCSGLEYEMDLAEGPQEGDQVIEDGDVKIYVDLKSYMYLAGLELDYSTALVGGGFKFSNPNATRTCSCGTSFAV